MKRLIAEGGQDLHADGLAERELKYEQLMLITNLSTPFNKLGGAILG